jgi:hypothetical protein
MSRALTAGPLLVLALALAAGGGGAAGAATCPTPGDAPPETLLWTATQPYGQEVHGWLPEPGAVGHEVALAAGEELTVRVEASVCRGVWIVAKDGDGWGKPLARTIVEKDGSLPFRAPRAGRYLVVVGSSSYGGYHAVRLECRGGRCRGVDRCGPPAPPRTGGPPPWPPTTPLAYTPVTATGLGLKPRDQPPFLVQVVARLVASPYLTCTAAACGPDRPCCNACSGAMGFRAPPGRLLEIDVLGCGGTDCGVTCPVAPSTPVRLWGMPPGGPGDPMRVHGACVPAKRTPGGGRP